MRYASDEVVNRLNDEIIDTMYEMDCEIDHAINHVLDANAARFVWSYGEVEVWELSNGERISVQRDGRRRAIDNEPVSVDE